MLDYELRNRVISLKNQTHFSITCNSQKKAKYEETYFIKLLETYILYNIAGIRDNSFVVHFGYAGHFVK